jgi:tRNA G46 methylase TrmB
MIKWLIKKGFYNSAELILNSLSYLFGNGCKIKYNKQGFWSHQHQGWIVNEAFPNFRFDIRSLIKEADAIYFYKYKVSPGDICIDIGAGIGMETLLMGSRIKDQGKVHAVEASPHTFRYLKANIANNRIKNAFSYNVAIADAYGKLKISTEPDHHIVN